MADPTYPADVADAVRSWLEETYRTPVLDAVAPTAIGTGFSTLIHFVQFTGSGLPPEWCAPLVVRIHQSVDQASVAATRGGDTDVVPRPRVPRSSRADGVRAR